MSRRFSRSCSGLSLILLCIGPAHAQVYPAKAVRVVIPFPVGGNTDVYARPISQKMSELYGQQMIVDNRPGAGRTIGVDLVAKAPADGYTLLWGNGLG